MKANGLPNQTLPVLLLSFVGMPLSVFIYLFHYPKRTTMAKQALYILFFVVLFVILEYVSVQFGAITYHNGWNLLWSLLFDCAMFIIIVIHHRKPKIALLLSVGLIILLSAIFELTFDKMK
jgi:hypothetical protein